MRDTKHTQEEQKEQLKRAVVHINDKDHRIHGTGFIFYIDESTSTHYILTCKHVVEDIGWPKKEVLVNGKEATVIKHQLEFDMIILKVANLQNQCAAMVLHISTSKQEDSAITMYGMDKSQKDYIVRELQGRVKKETIVYPGGKGISGRAWPFELYDEIVEQGYSGSPILDTTGRVLAIAYLRVKREAERQKGWAISVEHLIELWKHCCLPEDVLSQLFHQPKSVPPPPEPEHSEDIATLCPYNEEGICIWIHYASEDYQFVTILAGFLKKVGYHVRYRDPQDSITNQVALARHQLKYWANLSLFVVSKAYIAQSPITVAREIERAAICALHSITFKNYLLQIDDVEMEKISELVEMLPGSHLIHWGPDTLLFNQWQLAHILLHHRKFPARFVNREQQLEQCNEVLTRQHVAGLLICNRDGEAGMGNSMMLWHLQVCLYELKEAPVSIYLDWSLLLQEIGPRDWMQTIRTVLYPLVKFDRFEEVLNKQKASAPRKSSASPGTLRAMFGSLGQRANPSRGQLPASSRIPLPSSAPPTSTEVQALTASVTN